MVKGSVAIDLLGMDAGSQPNLPGFRNELGQYQAAQAQQLVRNQQFDEYLRSQVGIRIKNKIAFGERARASTGRLLRASIDKRNSLVTKEFIGVGRREWLDRSPVELYWRIFEEGTHGFVGTPVWFKGKYDFPSQHDQVPGIRTGSDDYSGRRATFYVKQEIEPANIYREMVQANIGEMKTFGFQSAHAFLVKAMGDPKVVADAGTTGAFPWS